MTAAKPGWLSGLVLIEPNVHADSRGFLVEAYQWRELLDAGINVEFVLEIQSRSEQGVVRGLHFRAPPGQAKLVRVARGRIFAVVVDIRPRSPTFGEHEEFELDDGDMDCSHSRRVRQWIRCPERLRRRLLSTLRLLRPGTRARHRLE